MSQHTPGSSSRVLVLHPRIYLDALGNTTTALLVSDGKILATGEHARAIGAPRTVRPDGFALFPALADAHVHLWHLGMRSGLLDLRHAPSPSKMLTRVAAARDMPRPPSGWIQGHGWDEHAWNKGAADAPFHPARVRASLDELFPHTPVCLYRVDYHACLANGEALRRAEIDATTHIDGGKIDRDPSTGSPTGLLIDAAMERLTSCIPGETEKELEQVFSQKASLLKGFGVSCAHMAWTSGAGLSMARRLYESGRLPLRIFCMIDCDDAQIDTILAEGPILDEHAWFSASCIKYFADGAMGSRGALMMEDYLLRDEDRGRPHRGLAVVPRSRLIEEIPRRVRQGFSIATHAIGDQAARDVLDAYALARAEEARVLLRLEHAQIMHDDDIARLREHDVIASVQPIHMYSDSPWAHTVLSSHQLERLYNWRRLHDSVLVAGGSDYPIDDPNPWHGIATFIWRKNAEGEIWRPEQCLSRTEALACYTTNAAHAAGWGYQLGKLLPGYAADIVSLSKDPLVCSLQELWDMQAELWMMGGVEL